MPWDQGNPAHVQSSSDWKRRKDFMALKVKIDRFCQNEAPNHVEYFDFWQLFVNFKAL